MLLSVKHFTDKAQYSLTLMDILFDMYHFFFRIDFTLTEDESENCFLLDVACFK